MVVKKIKKNMHILRIRLEIIKKYSSLIFIDKITSSADKKGHK